MRIRTALAAALVAWELGAASAQAPDPAGLPDINLLLLSEQLAARGWHLDRAEGNVQYGDTATRLAANGLRGGIGYSGVGIAEAEFVRAYGPSFAAAVERLGIIGGHTAGIFKADDLPPVRFFNLQGRAGAVFSSIGVAVDFNTFNSHDVDRMRTVVFDMIVPEVSGAVRRIGDTDLHWLGFSVFYGIRDFTDNRDRGEVEAVIAIFPMHSLNLYMRHEITDLDLVLDAIVFGSSGLSLLRRVSLYR